MDAIILLIPIVGVLAIYFSDRSESHRRKRDARSYRHHPAGSSLHSLPRTTTEATTPSPSKASPSRSTTATGGVPLIRKLSDEERDDIEGGWGRSLFDRDRRHDFVRPIFSRLDHSLISNNEMNDFVGSVTQDRSLNLWEVEHHGDLTRPWGESSEEKTPG